jgi:hypothetical protein
MSDCVIVYCGGKCGSRTLNETFNKNGFNCFHTHGHVNYIKFQKIPREHEKIKQLFNKDNKDNKDNKNDFTQPDTIFDVIDIACKKYKNVFIIDSYRTPIERKISAFFQNISIHLPNYNDLTIQEYINYFNDEMLYSIENNHSINEVLEHYNMPLFDNFDFEKKYVTFKQNNMTIIKILFNDIDNWGNILSEIFGKKITIHPNNLTKNKPIIYKKYKEFKDNYKVPVNYINNVLLDDKEFKIFNTITEQKKYIHDWLKKTYYYNNLPPIKKIQDFTGLTKESIMNKINISVPLIKSDENSSDCQSDLKIV